MHSRSILWVMPLALILAGAGAAQAQGTAFTYQGHLTDNGAAARGSYDLQFLLFDAAEAGIQQGVTLNRFGLAISNGLFTTTLDFGPNRFAGAPRWLEIRVSLANAANYATLTPRQPLTPAPYAMFASSASTAATAASVLWSAVIGVPVGFTDGVDNDTLYGAGLGLNLGSGNLFSVLYAGSGTSTSAARSDHDHLGQSWTGSQTRGLSVTTTLTSGTGVAGLLGRQGTGGGASLIIPSGLWGDSSDGQGVLGTAAGVNCRGVLGWNFGTNGLGTGVQGQSASSSGRGVWGLAYATTGTNHGVYGQSESPEGYGVYGANDAGVAREGRLQSNAIRRGGRAVDCDGLENRFGASTPTGVRIPPPPPSEFVNKNITLGIWAAVIAVVFFYCWRKGYLLRFRDYVLETREELKRCTWPTWVELKGSTLVVMVTIILLGAFTVLVDFVIAMLVRWMTLV